MLISVSRDVGPGLLMQGEKSGVHWRAMRDVQTFSIEGPHTVHAVYLQFFIDAGAFGVTAYHNTNCIFSPYNRVTVGSGGLILSLTSEYYSGSPLRHRLQWVETYYGKLRRSDRTGGYVGAEMFAAWYPRKQSCRHVTVLPGTFTKYIRLSAEYMCNYLALCGDD